MSDNRGVDSDEELIDCNGVGGILFVDQDDRKFYAEYQANDLNVKIGDCVRIKLADTSSDGQFGFAQILAIYERQDEEMYIEVRWLSQGHELAAKHRKIISPEANELIESCLLDDVAAGSVVEVIDIRGADPNKRLSGAYFICRYLESAHGSSLQKVSPHSMLQRGMEMSHYAFAYTDYLHSLDKEVQTDAFSQAIQRLHISVIPSTLPCREGERRTVEDFMRGAIASGDGAHRPIYICGLPGTGKTATVLASVNQLRREVEAGTLPEFSFIEINCLRLKSPLDAYTLLWRGLTGVHAAPKTALKNLTAHFNSDQQLMRADADSGSHKRSRRLVTVCLVDEMDYLISRNFDVMYHFYSWPQHRHANFVLIGIANTMDLPEKLSSKLNSRTDVGIDRIIFRPYNFEQIQEILTKRLVELQLDAINDKAREIVARKAASVAGDLRAALKICQRTIEMYRDLMLERKRHRPMGTKSAGAGGAEPAVVAFKDIVGIVKEAADSYKETPFIATTARACQLDKAILVVMGRHRQAVSGGEGNREDAALTCDAVWERLCDIVQKIDAERYLTKGTAAPSSGNSSSGASGGALTLRLPPYAVFLQAMERLCEQGIVVRATSWRVFTGPRSVLHSLHPTFTYSDLCAALMCMSFLSYVYAGNGSLDLSAQIFSTTFTCIPAGIAAEVMGNTVSHEKKDRINEGFHGLVEGLENKSYLFRVNTSTQFWIAACKAQSSDKQPTAAVVRNIEPKKALSISRGAVVGFETSIRFTDMDEDYGDQDDSIVEKGLAEAFVKAEGLGEEESDPIYFPSIEKGIAVGEDVLGDALPRNIEPWDDLVSDEAISTLAFFGLGQLYLTAARSPTASQVPGAVFEADLSFMYKYETRDPFERYGAIAIFNAAKKLLGIYWCLKSKLCTPPATGSNSQEWDHVKYVFKSTLITAVTLKDHLVHTHWVVSNNLLLATRQCLGEDHPLRRLLKPHTYRAAVINWASKEALLPSRGLGGRVFALTDNAWYRAIHECIRGQHFQTFDQYIAEKGLPAAVVDTLPFLQDGKDLWATIKTYVTAYLNIFYPDDVDVPRDKEIVDYWTFFAAEGDAFWPSYELPALTKANLVDQLTHSIFWVTGMHELVGSVVEYLRSPAGLGSKIRPDKAEADVQSFFQALTLIALTGIRQPALINDWTRILVPKSLEGAKRKAVVRVAKQFQEDLKALAKVIDTRNADKKARKKRFMSMNPSVLESSVSI